MNVPKQFLNLIGAVLVLAIVAAGALLVAVPVWTDSTTISSEADTVVQTNLAYETQIAALRESESKLSAIQASVVELRRGIPAEPRLDEVFEVAAAAAAATGLTIVSATAGDAVAWTPRAALTPGTVSTDDAAPPAATDGAATEAVPPVDGAAAAETSGEADAASPASPQIQVDFTVVLKAPDPAAADRYLDALANGSRLVSIVHAGLTPTTEGYDLTVNALAFVRTES